MVEAKLEPESATALGSARARGASSGGGRWCCLARCGRRRCCPTSSLSYCQMGRAVALDGPPPAVTGSKHRYTIVSYNAGISACAKGVQWQWALVLLNEMRKENLEPTEIYTTMQGPARVKKAIRTKTA
ncbi:unnamed protein product [Prorocentrum cordatum]|uniref:Pentatricopeptide repeat-containing protein n=1 Tax=Prorocentrum cordatum TaxID=2364126 RepID=A0ABN9XZG4_9DINO|nr:unnamed protein product [Polarella glacialis]